MDKNANSDITQLLQNRTDGDESDVPNIETLEKQIEEIKSRIKIQ